jgi:hypothetical protein
LPEGEQAAGNQPMAPRRGVARSKHSNRVLAERYFVLVEFLSHMSPPIIDLDCRHDDGAETGSGNHAEERIVRHVILPPAG